jgi:hypothetical protein
MAGHDPSHEHRLMVEESIMRRILFTGLAVAGLIACGKTNSQPGGDGSSNDARLTLRTGTEIRATTQRTISSRRDRAGESFTARVSADVMDSRGRIVIPAGAIIKLTITELKPATDKSKADGKIAVIVNSVTTNDQTFAISASVTSMAHTLKGQGVGAGEVEKTAGGAVVGGIIGRVVGGNATGTVVGAVVGGAAGAAVAVQTAHRDVVVAAGTPIVVTLAGPLNIQ